MGWREREKHPPRFRRTPRLSLHGLLSGPAATGRGHKYIADPMRGFETQTSQRGRASARRLTDPVTRANPLRLAVPVRSRTKDPVNRNMEGSRPAATLEQAGLKRIDTLLQGRTARDAERDEP
jgi:hypothetical protein